MDQRYGYGGRGEFELHKGGRYRVYPSEEMKKANERMGFPTPEVVVDGEILEVKAPRRLVQTWRMLMDPPVAAEGFTRLTYDLLEIRPGITRLTVSHELGSAAHLSVLMSGGYKDQGDGSGGGGWSWILSDLKTLLETGTSLAS